MGKFKKGDPVQVRVDVLKDPLARVPRGTVGTLDHYAVPAGWGMVRFPGRTGDGRDGLVKTWDHELSRAVSPAPVVVGAPGGPFDKGDTVRYLGAKGANGELSPGLAASAHTERGVIPGRVFTVTEGTTIVRGVIGISGTPGAWPARLFELVAKAPEPKPEPEPELKPGLFGTAVVGDVTRPGFTVDALGQGTCFRYLTERNGSTATLDFSDFEPMRVSDIITRGQVDNTLAGVDDGDLSWDDAAGAILALQAEV